MKTRWRYREDGSAEEIHEDWIADGCKHNPFGPLACFRCQLVWLNLRNLKYPDADVIREYLNRPRQPTGMLVEAIHGGGQTGADRGGWDAAIQLHMRYGGWVPAGRRAEDGTIPDTYNGTIWETLVPDYDKRTELNVCSTCASVVFTIGALTPGSRLTVTTAERYRRPCLHVDLSTSTVDGAARAVADFCNRHGVKILNVAGSRESKAPGIQLQVKRVLMNAFF